MPSHEFVTVDVLAERRGLEQLALEVPAGRCEVVVETTSSGLRRAQVTTPQPLAVDATVPVDLVATALGLGATEVRTTNHEPTVCGMGRPFVVAELRPGALDRARPREQGFSDAREAVGSTRFALLAYAREGADWVSARMFSPLTGTPEDAATGSANVAPVGLLLHHEPGTDELRLTSRQGVQMGRPSTLHVHAWRAQDGIRAAVGAAVVPVTTGHLTLS